MMCKFCCQLKISEVDTITYNPLQLDGPIYYGRMLGQVYPIVFIIDLGSDVCAYTVGRRALAHENVVWSKKYKTTGVANQYEHK